MSNKKKKDDEEEEIHDYYHQKSSSSDWGLLFLECLSVRSISDVELGSEYSRMIFIGGLFVGGGENELVSSL